MSFSEPKRILKTKPLHSISIAAIAFIVVVAMHLSASSGGHPWMAASMGAAMVLFHSNKDSSYFNFLSFNLLAAFLGVSIGLLFPPEAGYLAVASSLATIIFIMSIVDRMHPPAGATAVLSSLMSHEIGYGFILTPLLPNLIVMSLSLVFIKKWQSRQGGTTVS